MSATQLRQPKQSRSRRTLQRITRAALELIAEKGVEGTTISAIVRRAGSSVGSFYARFEGKDDLLTYLDERIWESAEERWNEATEGSWGDRAIGDRAIPEVVGGLAKLYAELELVHRAARDALAQALRGPGAGPSEAALRFKARVLEDSRRLLLDRSAAINHPIPDLAVETTCRSLEACALSLDPAVMADLCAALVRHLTGDHPSAPPSDEGVEFFDIWG
ncbi:MAG: TetR/AcrR family transcriptional regulator [Acidobacteria bacterium]|nr:TetR/AcrR family transcriptional regulator [Acidobacteriota bacterium]